MTDFGIKKYSRSVDRVILNYHLNKKAFSEKTDKVITLEDDPFFIELPSDPLSIPFVENPSNPYLFSFGYDQINNWEQLYIYNKNTNQPDGTRTFASVNLTNGTFTTNALTIDPSYQQIVITSVSFGKSPEPRLSNLPTLSDPFQRVNILLVGANTKSPICKIFIDYEQLKKGIGNMAITSSINSVTDKNFINAYYLP